MTTYFIQPTVPDSIQIFSYAMKIWEKLKDAASLKNENSDFLVTINPYLLKSAIEHSRIDLSRWVDFHLADQILESEKRAEVQEVSEDSEKRPDNHKIAGYLAYWIAKIRPIQVIPASQLTTSCPEMPRELYNINALFAYSFIIGLLDIAESDVPHEIEQDLIYRLNYRMDDPLSIAYAAYAAERIVRTERR